MFAFFVSAILLLRLTSGGVVSPVSRDQERLYGGVSIDIREAPWTASVHAVNPNGTIYHCAGCIVTPVFVATSAVCYLTVNTNDFMVRVGSNYHGSGGQYINVTDFLYRPDGDLLDKNVGLLHLAQSIVFGSTAYPIVLPSANSAIPYGKQSIITGWGFYDNTNQISDVLRRIVTEIWTDEADCRLHSPGFSNNTFCAGGVGEHGPCTKDSGAPLVVDNVLVGITIYPWSCYANTTSVFINVASQIEWIEAVIGAK